MATTINKITTTIIGITIAATGTSFELEAAAVVFFVVVVEVEVTPIVVKGVIVEGVSVEAIAVEAAGVA
jgi:hypothetical protein